MSQLGWSHTCTIVLVFSAILKRFWDRGSEICRYREGEVAIVCRAFFHKSHVFKVFPSSFDFSSYISTYVRGIVWVVTPMVQENRHTHFLPWTEKPQLSLIENLWRAANQKKVVLKCEELKQFVLEDEPRPCKTQMFWTVNHAKVLQQSPRIKHAADSKGNLFLFFNLQFKTRFTNCLNSCQSASKIMFFLKWTDFYKKHLQVTPTDAHAHSLSLHKHFHEHWTVFSTTYITLTFSTLKKTLLFFISPSTLPADLVYAPHKTPHAFSVTLQWTNLKCQVIFFFKLLSIHWKKKKETSREATNKMVTWRDGMESSWPIQGKILKPISSFCIFELVCFSVAKH